MLLVFCLFTLGRHGNFTAGVTMEQPDYLSIKDAHDRQYNYMKITIFKLIGMIRLIGFNIQDIQIQFSKQMIKKYLVTEYLLITDGEFLF
jgi:hypothetical protein